MQEWFNIRKISVIHYITIIKNEKSKDLNKCRFKLPIKKELPLIKTSLKLTANITFNRATMDSEVEIW